jgi:hypothetical protein
MITPSSGLSIITVRTHKFQTRLNTFTGWHGTTTVVQTLEHDMRKLKTTQIA